MIQYLILFLLIVFALIIGLNIGNWLSKIRKVKPSDKDKKR